MNAIQKRNCSVYLIRNGKIVKIMSTDIEKPVLFE